MNDTSRDSLEERLAQLPHEVSPAANLWPAIQSRIELRSRRPRPVLLAACVAAAAACLASMFTWAVLRRVQAPDGLPALAGVGTFQEPGDAKYIKARESLQQTFRERLMLLEPGTRAKIESSLAVIRHAHEDIRRALLADPSSPVLEDLWQSTLHDEIDLYDRVVEATQPAVRT